MYYRKTLTVFVINYIFYNYKANKFCPIKDVSFKAYINVFLRMTNTFFLIKNIFEKNLLM